MSKEHVKILFIDSPGEECQCDRCDNIKRCVHINFFSSDVYMLCKNCLQEIANKFDKDREDNA